MAPKRDVRAQSSWSWGSRAAWGVVALLVGLWQGPSFVWSLRHGNGHLCDFVQDWASARNLLEGRPIYEAHEISLARSLGWHPDPANSTFRFFLEVNAHPPTAVLLALPLAALDYLDAVLAWNLISLAALALSLWLM